MEYNYKSPLGDILISYNDHAITGAIFDGQQTSEYAENTVITECIKQLDEYFGGTRQSFDLPLEPKGTDFQKSVWLALQSIPYGETRSYAQVASLLGRPKASRAVGGANNKNPIHIIIPCHRVIGANGALTGYAGGLERKTTLLTLEKSNSL